MVEIDLIHAGLPWNNPLKITVKADLYISLLVINRGLLNLLSNDYYLDLKTERINQYIVLLFGPHIADTSIHWTEDGIVDIIKRFLNGELGNYLDGFGLLKDTAFIIPLMDGLSSTKNVNRIQNIINNCPKNLNGHTAIFALTPVADNVTDDPETEDIDESITYNHTIGLYYNANKEVLSTAAYILSQNFASSGCFLTPININLTYKSILVNSFYGGTVILMGNPFFTCESKYKDGGKSLNTRLTRMLLEQIQNCIDKDIVPNIALSGSGINNTCSVVAFNNCNCDSYLWNLNVTLNGDSQATAATQLEVPNKKNLAFYFPANCIDDKVTGNVRYIVADAINDENFNESYLTMRAINQTLSGGTVSGFSTDYPTISAVNLNNDYLMLSSSYKQFIQTLFGKYVEDGLLQFDSLYEGATLCFWMKDSFYTKNINLVPVLYSSDSNGNGFYFGLEKIVALSANNLDTTQYIETTYPSKKRSDLNDIWNFWAFTITSVDPTQNIYNVNAMYVNPSTFEPITVTPSRTAINGEQFNQIKFNNINTNYPVYFFGTPTTRLNSNIRNVLLFNTTLDKTQIAALAKQDLVDIYNLSEVDISKSFKNGMKGALYVYNTTSMNVIGCKLNYVKQQN